MDFLKPFENHNLMKFLSLSKQLNPNHVKEFLCNSHFTREGLECKFHGRLVYFTHADFLEHLGLEFKGKALWFRNSEFVEFISKYIFKNLLDSANFSIIQMK